MSDRVTRQHPSAHRSHHLHFRSTTSVLTPSAHYTHLHRSRECDTKGNRAWVAMECEASRRGLLKVVHVHRRSHTFIILVHFVPINAVGERPFIIYIKILYYFTIFISLLFNSNSLHTFNKILM